MHEWTPTLGAIYGRNTTTFRVWAPDHRSVELILERAEDLEARVLAREGAGYWSGTFKDIVPGDRYRYRLNGDTNQTFPDPASRFQPLGVHGPSEVVDSAAFVWTATGWETPPLADLVLYELHVGAFTATGTFRAIIERLGHLQWLGVNAIELMPIADFAGDRNWGYDGAALFSPSRAYGSPDDLRALVDAAHHHGISVVLDVVYNHFGPDGAYLTAFSQSYCTSAHQTPWGAAINLDGPRSPDVRRFLIENALHWIREYHLDGLRLDATHQLRDDGARHFLAELADTVRDHAGRRVHLTAEDERNCARLVLPGAQGGFGFDAVWADDFHHQARVHTAHDDEGYYADYSGTAADLAETIRRGWFFTGQPRPSTGAPRGTDPSRIAPAQCIVCLQNHDQVGNRADGARLTADIDLATFRALTTLLLLVPETPLLFMGQEWAATSPFLFFTDHGPELGRQVTEGRRGEFSTFRAFTDPARRASIPDPQERDTFERSRLRWDESHQSPHREILALHRLLIELRRVVRPGHLARGGFDATALDDHTLLLTLPGLSSVIRLAGSAVLDVTGRVAPIVFTTEDPGLTHDSLPIHVDRDQIRFARPGAVVMSTSLAHRSTFKAIPS
jgi:maltooligosyltrehalose trehalohydrolase